MGREETRESRIRSRNSNSWKIHDYLGMILDYTKKHHVIMDVMFYQEAIGEEFPEKIKPNSEATWGAVLFNVHDYSQKLNEDK